MKLGRLGAQERTRKGDRLGGGIQAHWDAETPLGPRPVMAGGLGRPLEGSAWAESRPPGLCPPPDPLMLSGFSPVPVGQVWKVGSRLESRASR